MDKEYFNPENQIQDSDYYIPNSDWGAEARLAITFKDFDFFNECNLDTQFIAFFSKYCQN